MTTDFTSRLAALRSEPSTDEARDPARLARVARTRTEMLAQAPAIRETLSREAASLDTLAAQLGARDIRRVVIAGCGDSWIVGMAVRHALETLLGIPVMPAQALDYAAYDHITAAPDTLVLGLSAGGGTPAVMQALAAARARGAFAAGLSNTPGSPVLTAFDGGMVVHATRRGWPTQSSTAAMALLVALGLRLAARRGSATTDAIATMQRHLDAVPGVIEAVTRDFDPAMAAIAATFASARLLMFTGAGPHFATAALGAAKIKELGPIHALAIPLEEMHHYRAQKAGDPLILVAPDDASRERALDTALVSEAVGGRTVALLGRDDPEIASRVAHALVLPAVPEAFAPLVHTVPLHLFAYHFAQARAALGLGAAGAWPEASTT
jgi:glucosamine--fructose-6-phosphate aminotransferase (isomerizing)